MAGLLSIGPFLYAGNEIQQQNQVTVTVTDANGPLAGATVVVKGTTLGELSDADGVVKFNNLSSDAVLIISYVGYVTQEISVGGRSTLSVVLAEDIHTIDELIVVGYGTQKKASQTSAIASIRAEDVVTTKQNDLVTSLQGKIPGLLIRQSGGTAGKFYSNISMRGYGTPIVVIDGIVRSEPYVNAQGYGVSTDLALAQLNPNDIESITVLKDASASIYGLGAGNGVILVTTKKGQSIRPTINYSNIFSFGSPKMPKEMDMVDLMTIDNEMADNARYPRKWTEAEIEEYRNQNRIQLVGHDDERLQHFPEP